MGSTRWWCSASARCCSWPACSPACCPRRARRECTRCMPCATTRDRRHATEPSTEDEGMNIWLTEIWRAWRASLRRPGFLLLASGVLALGIGASVAVFALIDATLLRPLPVPQPARLVAIGRMQGDHVRFISPLQYRHLVALEGVSSVGIYQAGVTANITEAGAAEQVPAVHADQGLLPTFGLRPVLGRNF